MPVKASVAASKNLGEMPRSRNVRGEGDHAELSEFVLKVWLAEFMDLLRQRALHQGEPMPIGVPRGDIIFEGKCIPSGHCMNHL